MTTDEPQLATAPELVRKPVDQLGFVVPDLRAAIEHWLSLGVGPWFVARSANASHRREPKAPDFDTAFSYIGDIQLELICPAEGEPSIYHEFAAAGGSGLHHFGWFSHDLPGVRAAALARGHKIVQGGSTLGMEFACFELAEPIRRPAYLIATGDATVLHADLVLSTTAAWEGTFAEVISPSRQTRKLFAKTNETVRNWDGWTDPVRQLRGTSPDVPVELQRVAQRIARWTSRGR
jgi:hypothetical protein